MRRNQGDHVVATEAKPVRPVGQPISASANSGFKVRRGSEVSLPAIGVTRTWRPSRPFTASANRSKGARGPLDWLPPDQGFRCQYVLRFRRIAKAYGLAFTAADERDLAALTGRVCGV
ncbi:hypothetical protein LZ190_13065 [Rhodovulum sulfidophilum]|nr:hypothetical protein [Rhodovulum sulfidophilum]